MKRWCGECDAENEGVNPDDEERCASCGAEMGRASEDELKNEEPMTDAEFEELLRMFPYLRPAEPAGSRLTDEEVAAELAKFDRACARARESR